MIKETFQFKRKKEKNSLSAAKQVGAGPMPSPHYSQVAFLPSWSAASPVSFTQRLSEHMTEFQRAFPGKGGLWEWPLSTGLQQVSRLAASGGSGSDKSPGRTLETRSTKKSAGIWVSKKKGVGADPNRSG